MLIVTNGDVEPGFVRDKELLMRNIHVALVLKALSMNGNCTLTEDDETQRRNEEHFSRVH